MTERAQMKRMKTLRAHVPYGVMKSFKATPTHVLVGLVRAVWSPYQNVRSEVPKNPTDLSSIGWPARKQKIHFMCYWKRQHSTGMIPVLQHSKTFFRCNIAVNIFGKHYYYISDTHTRSMIMWWWMAMAPIPSLLLIMVEKSFMHCYRIHYHHTHSLLLPLSKWLLLPRPPSSTSNKCTPIEWATIIPTVWCYINPIRFFPQSSVVLSQSPRFSVILPTTDNSDTYYDLIRHAKRYRAANLWRVVTTVASHKNFYFFKTSNSMALAFTYYIKYKYTYTCLFSFWVILST